MCIAYLKNNNNLLKCEFKLTIKCHDNININDLFTYHVYPMKSPYVISAVNVFLLKPFKNLNIVTG